jgi:threonylcarbamoyladenosine tRNA methylthiotransferase MtaB
VKFSIITFGCRVNQADSFVIEEELRRRGAVDSTAEDADIVVVNSCSVTATADQGTRQTIRRIVRNNPGVKVVVTGCYATRRPEEIRELPNVVRIVPNDDKESLVGVLESSGVLTSAERFAGGDGPCGMLLEPGVAGRTALTVRVQTGCNEQCSYCIIPSTRGRSRSRPLANVLADLRRAVSAGYREMAITGVHLGSYGRDLDDGTTLTDLVDALAAWPDDVLFRISSLEPMDCTRDIVRITSQSPRIAPHFHLPLQHGSDEMLVAMRRPYTTGYYRALIELIRGSIAHASIGTDLIVGFPGETSEHFDKTVTFVGSLSLSYLHVFPYSDRPGTVASDLPDKVDGGAIRQRGRILRDLGAAKVAEFRSALKGRTMRALTVDEGWSAVTGNHLKVRLDAQRPRNSWVTVTL